jgi:hypothetical protein
MYTPCQDGVDLVLPLEARQRLLVNAGYLLHGKVGKAKYSQANQSASAIGQGFEHVGPGPQQRK